MTSHVVFGIDPGQDSFSSIAVVLDGVVLELVELTAGDHVVLNPASVLVVRSSRPSLHISRDGVKRVTAKMIDKHGWLSDAE